MLYFWNVDKLVYDMRNGLVSQFDTMCYLLASLITNSIAVPLTNVSKFFISTTMLEVLLMPITLGVMMGILVWGVLHCYRINKNNDDKNFIERYICLSFPITIRVILFSIFLVFVLVAISFMLIGTHMNSSLAAVHTRAITFITEVIVGVIYFLYLGKKIDEVGRQH